MQPPDELMTQVFLPSMRQLVALKLRSEGLSQSKIASMLGTTQASVSLYLSSGAKKSYDALEGLHVSKSDAEALAARLCEAAADSPAEGVRALMEVWLGLLGRASVCDAHRAAYPSLAGCDVCVVQFGRGRGEKEEAISEVKEAVRLLEGSPDFVAVMPEVSVNIACAVGDPSTPADIVAVPGRIVKVRGRAKAMLPPEAGASVHMAKILLLARSRHPGLRACLNLRYDQKMDRAMRKSGLRTLSVESSPRPRVDDPTARAFEGKLRATRQPFDALVEEGGGGIEPNVYLFAKGAKEAAGLAIRLARAYSAG